MRFPERNLFIAALLMFALSAPAPAQTQADFFDDSVVQEIRLRLHPSDWLRLKSAYLENTYYSATFEWRGLVVEDIAIRSRGQGSRSPIKPNLRLDFNRFEEKQKFLGLKACDLKANNQDASFLKERLSMLLFERMGLPAPREAFARLYINNEFVGLYLLVEEVNKDFLMRNFGEDEGYLYEWQRLLEGYHFEYRGADPGRYSPDPFDPKTHEKDPDPRPLEAMIRTINQSTNAEFPGAVAEFLDLKQFVTHMALENFLSEIDGILGDVYGMNNFYFYRFAGRNFSQLIVWDKDLTFYWFDRDIWHNVNSNVLMRRALEIPEVRSAYLEALVKCAVLAGGPGGWLEQEIDRKYNLIRDVAREDPVKQYSEGGVQKPSSNEQFESEVARVREFARVRSADVLRQVKLADFQLSGAAPRLDEGGVVNAATGTAGGLAPGSFASAYGERLAETTSEAGGSPLPTTLAGVSVFINGFPAPLQFVSPTQLNFQVPWEVGSGSLPVTIVMNGTLGNTITANITATDPLSGSVPTPAAP